MAEAGLALPAEAAVKRPLPGRGIAFTQVLSEESARRLCPHVPGGPCTQPPPSGCSGHTSARATREGGPGWQNRVPDRAVNLPPDADTPDAGQDRPRPPGRRSGPSGARGPRPRPTSAAPCARRGVGRRSAPGGSAPGPCSGERSTFRAGPQTRHRQRQHRRCENHTPRNRDSSRLRDVQSHVRSPRGRDGAVSPRLWLSRRGLECAPGSPGKSGRNRQQHASQQLPDAVQPTS